MKLYFTTDDYKILEDFTTFSEHGKPTWIRGVSGSLKVGGASSNMAAMVARRRRWRLFITAIWLSKNLILALLTYLGYNSTMING